MRLATEDFFAVLGANVSTETQPLYFNIVVIEIRRFSYNRIFAFEFRSGFTGVTEQAKAVEFCADTNFFHCDFTDGVILATYIGNVPDHLVPTAAAAIETPMLAVTSAAPPAAYTKP